MAEFNRTNLAFKYDDAFGTEVLGSNVTDLPLDASFLDIKEGGSDISIDTSDSISDALIRCIRDTGRVDIFRIAVSAGVTSKDVVDSLRGSIFCNPDKWGGEPFEGWETADEYLSGDLRYKLIKARMAYRMHDGYFADNINALEGMLPPETRAEDIYVTLGSPWLPPEIIDDFVNYLIRPHSYHSCEGTIHDPETGSWEIPNKQRLSRYIRNKATYGTSRIDAVHIIERTLNMRTVRVTDEVSNRSKGAGSKRIINREETAAAQEKQKLIIAEFKRWIWDDEDRKSKVKKAFDNKYSYNVARRFDGRFLEFPGMSDEVSLYPYQKNAVSRIIFSSNTLLAHDVGAGKTYIMIAAAMELKRLGMSNKPMFVVPNNLVEQWQTIFLNLYPNADILCVQPKDMNPDRINRTLRSIADEQHDGIIIAYSCFDRIPLSRSSHMEALTAERDALLKQKSKKKDTTTKFDKRLEKLSKEISELAVKKDSSDLICFDRLGIDRLFVDEAHNYKNVSIDTSIYGIFGINRKGSAKCDSMMEKVHYVQRTHNGGGVVMATGTPITNSVSDIFVFQQYLQSGELELLGIQTFDSWVGMFAEKTTEFEIAVDTNSYRLATRFSRFHNIPELTNILASIADFHVIDADADLPDFGGYTDIVIPRTKELQDYLEEISERADKVHNKEVSRDEDNMLKITGDGRKAALDIRLVNTAPEILSEEGTGVDNSWKSDIYGQHIERCKVSECAERVARIWHGTKSDRLTQLIFCDTSTPKAGFNIYDELKRRLIDLGVDEPEIEYIHNAATEAKREKLFSRIREGRIRIVIGSTFKLGLGVNVQDRLVAVHHLDLPWRPADMVQREGRILRTGNINDKVEIYRYITEGSFDAYSWQLLETKQRFITDILSGTISGRSGSEVDDTVLDYAEVKALALGNPLLKSRVETQNEISRLSALHRKSIENRLRLEQRYDELPEAIELKRLELEICKSDAEYVRKQGKDLYKGLGTRERKEMASWRKYIREYLADNLYEYVMKDKDEALIEYRGFSVVLPAKMHEDQMYLYLVREGRYRVDVSDKETGVLIRIDNFIDKLNERVRLVQRELDILKQEYSEIEKELIKPSTYAETIEEYMSRLDEIDKELGLGDMIKQIN